MANEIIRYRWERVLAPQLQSNAPRKVLPGEAFSINFDAILLDPTTIDYNGIYMNALPSDPSDPKYGAVSVVVTPRNFSDLNAHLRDGSIVKLTKPIPSVVPTPAPEHTGSATVWKAFHRYMTGDRIMFMHTIRIPSSIGGIGEVEVDIPDYSQFFVSLLDNNVQGTFVDKWVFGAVTPQTQMGLATFPSGSQHNMGRARRLLGAPYFATDTKKLFVHSGKESLKDDDAFGFVDIMGINDHDPALEDQYAYGSLVHGFLRGRYRETNHIIETWGIFRRDNVPVWNIHEPYFLEIGVSKSFSLGDEFYMNQLPGEDSNTWTPITNGIYKVVKIPESGHITTMFTAGQGGTHSMNDHLQAGHIVRLTYSGAITPSPTDTFPPEIRDTIDAIRPVTDRFGIVHNVGDKIYDNQLLGGEGGIYSVYYECQYHNFLLLAPFDPLSSYLGWTCLADLASRIDYPNRVPAYIYLAPDWTEFPEIGHRDTLYFETTTNKIFFWNEGTQSYEFLGEDVESQYPNVKTLRTELFSEEAFPNLDPEAYVDAIIWEWETRTFNKVTQKAEVQVNHLAIKVDDAETENRIQILQVDDNLFTLDFNANYVESIEVENVDEEGADLILTNRSQDSKEPFDTTIALRQKHNVTVSAHDTDDINTTQIDIGLVTDAYADNVYCRAGVDPNSFEIAVDHIHDYDYIKHTTRIESPDGGIQLIPSLVDNNADPTELDDDGRPVTHNILIKNNLERVVFTVLDEQPDDDNREIFQLELVVDVRTKEYATIQHLTMSGHFEDALSAGQEATFHVTADVIDLFVKQILTDHIVVDTGYHGLYFPVAFNRPYTPFVTMGNGFINIFKTDVDDPEDNSYVLTIYASTNIHDSFFCKIQHGVPLVGSPGEAAMDDVTYTSIQVRPF